MDAVCRELDPEMVFKYYCIHLILPGNNIADASSYGYGIQNRSVSLSDRGGGEGMEYDHSESSASLHNGSHAAGACIALVRPGLIFLTLSHH